MRPTADRVREALFSILGDVGGARVLDLFAGTGALAIEALSRGAAEATLVDTDTAPAERNVSELGLGDRARVIRADARAFLRREQGSFDLVFCDPPYKLADRLGPELDRLLPQLLAPEARVITEIVRARAARAGDPRRGRAPLRRHAGAHPRSSRLMSPNGRLAVCPGTYDPVTNGHLDIISRTANVFERVMVGVVGNAPRKSEHLFTAEERRDFIRDATAHLENVEVEIFRTLLVEFAREQGATAIVKGLRAISDFEYEFEMNQLNRKLAPEIEAMYVIASPSYSFLSSTGVKEMAMFGGDVSDLVPDGVSQALTERAKS